MLYIKTIVLLFLLASLNSQEKSKQTDYYTIIIKANCSNATISKIIYKNLSDNTTNFNTNIQGVNISSQTIVKTSNAYTIDGYVNCNDSKTLDELCLSLTNYMQKSGVSIKSGYITKHKHPDMGKCEIENIYLK